MTTTGPSTGPLGEVTCVEADAFCVSGSSGQIRAGSEQGLFVRDTRALNTLVLLVNGAEPQPLLGRAVDANAARFTGYWWPGPSAEPDPKLLIDRRRVVSASLWEEFRLTNYGIEPMELVVELVTGTDFAYIFDVRHGRDSAAVAAQVDGGDLSFHRNAPDQSVFLRPVPPADELDERGGVLRWSVPLRPRDSWVLTMSVGVTGRGKVAWPTRKWSAVTEADVRRLEHPWHVPAVRCTDQRFVRLVQQSAADLSTLLVHDPDEPENRFLAAGSPWFLTLFGRDSLWAASMALPLGADLAGETLRVLARRQGTRHDPETEEAPGKIIHEVRHGGLADRADLPPLYYGTMDATPLFVTLLHEAWRWGLPAARVEALLPAAEAALAWMVEDGDADGDGFLEYIQSGERGLANQGWKDSVDAVQFADGRLAQPPIALAEVQGYAYDAARRGAELLDAFARPGADRWRDWARDLRDAFRRRFWVDDGNGPYPALALDGDKRRVDVVASNMGHLPATGLLDPEECDLVAARLGAETMDSGWGLRTMTSDSPRFNPLSYHGGSVWPHDTAIAVANLACTGHAAVANRLFRGLMTAAPFFDYRLPELFGGEQYHRTRFPLPYPAACRPQAWAAGAGLLLLRAALGLQPHLPEGRLELRPLWPPPLRQLQVGGLRLDGESVTVIVERGRGVYVGPTSLKVDVVGAPRLEQPPEVIGWPGAR